MAKSTTPDSKVAHDAKEVVPDSSPGHTQWDAALEVLRLMGRAAPYVLILAASAFAVYKYFELNQHTIERERTAQNEAQRLYQGQISDANQRLRETYVSMGEISKTQ